MRHKYSAITLQNHSGRFWKNKIHFGPFHTDPGSEYACPPGLFHLIGVNTTGSNHGVLYPSSMLHGRCRSRKVSKRVIVGISKCYKEKKKSWIYSTLVESVDIKRYDLAEDASGSFFVRAGSLQTTSVHNATYSIGLCTYARAPRQY